MTTPNMNLSLPVDHGSLDVWGAALNAALTTIDSHGHVAGQGVPIVSGALKINADVPWNFGGTHYAVTDALAYDLFPTTAASVASYAGALFANSALNGGDLCWRTVGGAVVQITNAGSLNFSVTGGFGGDYTAVGALALFTDASDQYTFQQQVGAGVRQYARMASADIDLFEYKANPAGGVPTTRVRQKSPAGLAGSYDLTWLAALPAANQILSVDNTGAITAGSATALSGTNKITANDFLHTGVWQAGFDLLSGFGTNVTPTEVLVTATNNTWTYRTRKGNFITGDKIISVSSIFTFTGGGTYVAKLQVVNNNVTTTAETWSGAAGAGLASHTLSTPYTLVAGDRVFVEFDSPAGQGNTDTITDIRATWTRPV